MALILNRAGAIILSTSDETGTDKYTQGDGMAGLVCLLTPVAGMGVLVFVIALVVTIIAGVTGSHLSDDEDHGGYWQKDPNSSCPT